MQMAISHWVVLKNLNWHLPIRKFYNNLDRNNKLKKDKIKHQKILISKIQLMNSNNLIRFKLKKILIKINRKEISKQINACQKESKKYLKKKINNNKII